ncbi:HAD family hydrolase [Streptomyces capparidis]
MRVDTRATRRTGTGTAGAGQLRRAFGGAECVIFDFDGPLCHLFAACPVAPITRRMRALIADAGLLPPGCAGLTSPHEILRRAALHGSGPAVRQAVQEAERFLTACELTAAAGATPTPHAGALVGRLAADGVRLAVASNNAPEAVHAHLARAGLDRHFSAGVHGRTRDPARMKPDPDCLLRAVAALGARPGACLFIGDAPADAEAARRAAVPFLGLGRNPDKARALREAGAELVVATLAEAVRALD